MTDYRAIAKKHGVALGPLVYLISLRIQDMNFRPEDKLRDPRNGTWRYEFQLPLEISQPDDEPMNISDISASSFRDMEREGLIEIGGLQDEYGKVISPFGYRLTKKGYQIMQEDGA